MTREEAIRELKIQFVGEYDRQREAKDMAIQALEQEPCVDATNGQVLLQMFPPSVYFGDDEKHIVLLTKDCELTCYNNEWWNAPYKTDKGDKDA